MANIPSVTELINLLSECGMYLQMFRDNVMDDAGWSRVDEILAEIADIDTPLDNT